MNYTVSGIFSVRVKAANSADAKEIVERMFRTSSKVRFYIIEIEEGKPSESGISGEELEPSPCSQMQAV